MGFDWDTNNNVPSRCWHHFDISNLANVNVAPGISHYRKLSCAGQRGKFKHNSFELFSSFPVIHKVGNVDIFVLPEFEKYKR